MAIKKGFLARASGPLQLAGAVFEAWSHGLDAWHLHKKGDKDAAVWAGTAAVALGAAGVIGGASAMVASGFVTSSALAMSGIGLIAALGVLLLVGLGALYMKYMSEDRPLDVWVSRTVFGIPRTIFFLGNQADILYKNLSEELKGYYITSYSPIKLDEAKDILSSKAGTDWEERCIKMDQAKFIFLLPGYIDGMSAWEHHLDGYEGRNIKNDEDRENTAVTEPNRKVTIHEEKLKKEGLYVYLSGHFEQFNTDSAGLKITYHPQGSDHEPVEKYLYVDD